MTRERDRIQENANKYIVKNCPCYMNQPGADCWADQLSWCENCTGCVIKQVIEKCKTIIEKDYKEEDRHLFPEDYLKILDRISEYLLMLD